MRRYYVCPLSVVLTHRDRFHPGMAWYAYHLVPSGTGPGPDPMVLVSAAFSTEDNEEVFSDHPEVACLPHPQFEGSVKIADTNLDRQYLRNGQLSIIPIDLHPHRAKKFHQVHADALKHCTQLRHDELTDTVLDLSVKAAAVWPDLRLRNLY